MRIPTRRPARLTARFAARLAAPLTVLALAVGSGAVVGPATAQPDAGPAPAAPAADRLLVTGFALGSLPHGVLRRDAHALHTVSVAGVGLRADGRSVIPPTRSMLGVGRAARQQGLHTELLLSNYSDELGGFDAARARRLLGSDAAVDRVAAQVAGLVADGGWDGVNIDLELLRRADAPGLVALARALQEAMPEASTVSVDLSAAGSPRAYLDRGYALRDLADAVDVIELMTYDQHGPTWSEPGPVAGLGWQRRSAEALLTRVPAAQVDLGVPGYGYTWPGPDSTRPGRSIKPGGARALVRRTGAEAVWHPRSGEWSTRLPDGTRIWWADARSYRLRVDLAADLGLRGLALWRLGSADPLPRLPQTSQSRAR